MSEPQPMSPECFEAIVADMAALAAQEAEIEADLAAGYDDPEPEMEAGI